jgi:hypothetical protein
VSATTLLVRKEYRALAGLWLAVAAGVLLGELPEHDFRDFEVVLYVIGALGLGAACVGHEYRYGTLAQLLTQPVSRARLLAIKLSVLAAFLLALAALAGAVTFAQLDWNARNSEGLRALFVLPLLYGLLVAPWLTLKTRNILAGTLFSGSLASLLFIVGDRIAAARGLLLDDVEAFRLNVVWTGSIVLCAWAAFSLWRSVATLEAVDGVRSELALPGGLRGRTSVELRRRHPLRVLAGKELRLQQLTFVPSALYVAAFLFLRGRANMLFYGDDALMAATVIHAVIVVALAGAMSCAEERVLGTLSWQLLQPVSGRVQFAVKLAMTLAVTLLLTLGLPALLFSVFGGISEPWRAPTGAVASALALLLAGSIYLSSVAPSAVSAFFLCVPAFLVESWYVQRILRTLAYSILMALHPGRGGKFPRVIVRAGIPFEPIVVTAIVLLLLAFAFENHRRADRSLWRAARQIASLAAAAAAVFGGFAVAGHWLFR